jgi:hypothetical protein
MEPPQYPVVEESAVACAVVKTGKFETLGILYVILSISSTDKPRIFPLF